MTGLRDAKRAALARRLARIAFEQVRERGFAGVTVEDIVAEAEVSRRTFSNYYTCKEAAVAAVVIHGVETALSDWNPPPSDDVLTLVRDLVAHQVDAGALRALTEVAGLAGGHPQLVPFVREAQWQVWVAVGDRVLEALRPPDAAAVETVRLVVGALFGVVSAGVGAVDPVRADAPRMLHAAVVRALSTLERGISRVGDP